VPFGSGKKQRIKMIKRNSNIEYYSSLNHGLTLLYCPETLPKLFQGFLLRGYTRILLHKLTPYSEKRPELPQNIFNWLKWVQCCTLATSDVIFI